MTSRGRLNARLDEEMQRKVAYLRKRTGLDTSDLVRASLDHYYEAIRSGGGKAREILEESGFIGIAPGPADLSERYKDVLTRTLEKKHS
jgi:hypothetical protein